MFDFFVTGGPLFMSLISFAALTALYLTVRVVLDRLSGTSSDSIAPGTILVAGSLAFMLGILGQTIGIFQALTAIQQAGGVSPAMIYGGFRVSLIAPMYGLIVFVITLIIRLILIYIPAKQS